jgi:hypothetical protein
VISPKKLMNGLLRDTALGPYPLGLCCSAAWIEV